MSGRRHLERREISPAYEYCSRCKATGIAALSRHFRYTYGMRLDGYVEKSNYETWNKMEHHKLNP